MEENKDLELTANQHNLDENENPSSLNLTSSIGTVNDSFNMMNSISDKYLSESQNLPDSILISSNPPTPQKNSFIDCENLEKTNLPDLVNNSICESVDNDNVNDIQAEKQVSFCSANDNSLNTNNNDISLNASANTTANSLIFSFGRMTLNSGGNTSTCDNLNSSPVVESENKAPINETFVATNPVDLSSNADFDSFGSDPSKISESVSQITSEASVDNDNFKHPFPVPESGNMLDFQKICNEYSFTEKPDEFEGEEFQDAVQFFKDPSSYQALENLSSTSGANMPRDSLYMNFDPLYKKGVQPIQSVNAEEKDINVENNQTINVPLGISLQDDLVSFDSTNEIALNVDEDINNECGKDVSDVGCAVNEQVEKNDDQVVSKPICNVPSGLSLQDKLVAIDSPIKNCSAAIADKDFNKESSKDGISEEDSAVSELSIKINDYQECQSLMESPKENECGVDIAENDQIFELVNKRISIVQARRSLGENLLSFDSPVKSNSENQKAVVIESEHKLYTEEEFQHALKIYELTMQESLLKQLKKIEENSSKKQKDLEEEALRKEKVLEEKILKKQEDMEEVLKKYKEMEETLKQQKEEALKEQKELEEEALQKQEELIKDSNTTKKLHQITELNKALLETISDLAALATEQNTKIGELSSRIVTLEDEKQKLESDLKTSTEDLQSVEHTFSDFHKRYVQCKDMLKTYKENEDCLRNHVESLNKRHEEQEQTISALHVKMQEEMDKANAELASAKKGGNAQVAILRAQLKKSELKVSSLESDLKQVRIENDKLGSICDDLMAKVSEA